MTGSLRIVKGNFRSIVWPAGARDVLEFNVDDHPMGCTHMWIATWVGHRSLDHAYYKVYDWKGEWAYNRPDHPILGSFRGRVDTRDEAMQRCANDFAKVARLARWIDYLTTHEPPEVP